MFIPLFVIQRHLHLVGVSSERANFRNPKAKFKHSNCNNDNNQIDINESNNSKNNIDKRHVVIK